MSYQSIETSPYSSQPFELYFFATADQSWYLTSADHSITYLGNVYTPVSIKRTATSQTGETKSGQIRITMPLDNAVPQLFLPYCPDSPLFIIIYRGHGGDADVVVNFTGRVNLCRFGDFAELTCIPSSDMLKNLVPQMNFQSPCNHFLYDSGCKVDKSAFATPGTISAIDSTGTLVTVPAAGALAAGWFTTGYLEIGQQRRMILLHNGTVLTLMDPLNEVEVGAEVTLYAGCMRDYGTCQAKFSNGKNFLGFQWVPTKNPFKDPFN
jgi:uncharacterized phage protein (TIGR02218 family)